MNAEETLGVVSAAVQRASAIATTPGTALAPTGVTEAEAVRAGFVEQRAALMRAKQDVEQAAASARAEIEAQTKRLQAELQAKLAELEPALKQLARLNDGVHALNIYLGRGEEMEQLLDGDPAPEGTPITVRQTVLAMDEESLVAADSYGMDFSDIPAFTAWLQRDPAHLDQLLPEPKGVVALIPRRAEKSYGDPWSDAAAKIKNHHTYWLVRNGGRVFITTTDFVVGDKTVPTANEFTDMFLTNGAFGRERVPLEPGSKQWLAAEEFADNRTRHYMKVALLLQGLVDRTAVFHPHDGVSFLDQSHYDAGRVRVILDGEMVLSDGKPSYREWRSQHVAAMHEGMRVIGHYSSRMKLYSTKDRDSDVRPEHSCPTAFEPYNVTATRRSYYDWQFSFERTEKSVWDDDEMDWRAPKTKATGYLSNSDAWWLPLDAVSIEDLRYYLNSRTNRRDYLDMIPTLRAALQVKEAEFASEAPFRTALMDALVRDAGYSSGEAEKQAPELVAWFKVANKWHRALDADDARAYRVIIAEARRRMKGGDKDAERAAELRRAHPDAVVVARRSNDFIVVEPMPRRYPNAPTNVWAALHVYTPGGKLKETREWVTFTRAQVARWTLHHVTETWSGWHLNVDADQQFTDVELDHIVRLAREATPGVFIVRVGPDSKNPYSRGLVYAWDGERVLSSGFRVGHKPDGTIGIGSLWMRGASDGHDEPTWQVKWYGELHPDSDMWRDETVVAKMLSVHERKLADSQQRRQAQDRMTAVMSRVERSWDVRAEAQAKAHFVEEFGDESLWEHHSKSQKFPDYPHRWNADKPIRENLVKLLTALPDFELEPMTVRELAETVGVQTDDLPDDLLELTL